MSFSKLIIFYSHFLQTKFIIQYEAERNTGRINKNKLPVNQIKNSDLAYKQTAALHLQELDNRQKHCSKLVRLQQYIKESLYTSMTWAIDESITVCLWDLDNNLKYHAMLLRFE